MTFQKVVTTNAVGPEAAIQYLLFLQLQADLRKQPASAQGVLAIQDIVELTPGLSGALLLDQ